MKPCDVLPAHLLHRPLRVLEPARILAHHRLPQGLGAGGLEQPEALRDAHPMARVLGLEPRPLMIFLGQPLRLLLRRAHPEPTGRDPAHALNHPVQLEARKRTEPVLSPFDRPTPAHGRRRAGDERGWGMTARMLRVTRARH